jgi:hypothetical protein
MDAAHRGRSEEEEIATPSNPIDRALKTHKSRSRMVSAVILALGILVVIAVMFFSPSRRRERAAGGIQPGDDSTAVLSRLGDKPQRCPPGEMQHVYNAFEGSIPRTTREAALEQIRQQTSARWIYPARGCTPSQGDTEVGLGTDGRVLWLVPATGLVPMVYPDTLVS